MLFKKIVEGGKSLGRTLFFEEVADVQVSTPVAVERPVVRQETNRSVQPVSVERVAEGKSEQCVDHGSEEPPRGSSKPPVCEEPVETSIETYLPKSLVLKIIDPGSDLIRKRLLADFVYSSIYEPTADANIPMSLVMTFVKNTGLSRRIALEKIKELLGDKPAQGVVESKSVVAEKAPEPVIQSKLRIDWNAWTSYGATYVTASYCGCALDIVLLNKQYVFDVCQSFVDCVYNGIFSSDTSKKLDLYLTENVLEKVVRDSVSKFGVQVAPAESKVEIVDDGIAFARGILSGSKPALQSESEVIIEDTEPEVPQEEQLVDGIKWARSQLKRKRLVVVTDDVVDEVSDIAAAFRLLYYGD